MKFLVAVCTFIVTLGLTTQSLAENEKAAAHGAGHAGLSEKMNSLYPTKQPDGVSANRPSLATLKSPAFLSTVGAGSVKLEWNASTGASEYHLQVATDPNFKWLVVNEKFVKATTYDFAKAEAGTRYFWRVAGFNGSNTSSYTKSNFVSSSFNVK